MRLVGIASGAQSMNKLTCRKQDEGSAGVDYPRGQVEDRRVLSIGDGLVDANVRACRRSRGDRPMCTV